MSLYQIALLHSYAPGPCSPAMEVLYWSEALTTAATRSNWSVRPPTMCIHLFLHDVITTTSLTSVGTAARRRPSLHCYLLDLPHGPQRIFSIIVPISPNDRWNYSIPPLPASLATICPHSKNHMPVFVIDRIKRYRYPDISYAEELGLIWICDTMTANLKSSKSYTCNQALACSHR